MSFSWEHSKFQLVRMNAEMVVATDTQCNIIKFDSNLVVKFTILNAHSRLITDLQIMLLPD